MKYKKLLVIAALMVSGCTMTPEECDPSNVDAGFFDKLGCVTSGSYDARIESKKQEIVKLNEEQKVLLAEIDELSKKIEAEDQKKADLTKDLNTLQGQINSLEKDITSSYSFKLSNKTSSKLLVLSLLEDSCLIEIIMNSLLYSLTKEVKSFNTLLNFKF